MRRGRDTFKPQARAVWGTTTTSKAEGEAREALECYEERVLKAAAESYRLVVLLELDTKLTKALVYRFINPRGFLRFQPYQKLWDSLEGAGLRPVIRIISYETGRFGPVDEYPAICARVPRR